MSVPTKILNMSIIHRHNGVDYVTCAQYEDEQGNQYAASHPGVLNIPEMRDFITFCRRHDRGRKANLSPVSARPEGQSQT